MREGRCSLSCCECLSNNIGKGGSEDALPSSLKKAKDTRSVVYAWCPLAGCIVKKHEGKNFRFNAHQLMWPRQETTPKKRCDNIWLWKPSQCPAAGSSPPPSASASSGSPPASCPDELQLQGMLCLDDSDFSSKACRSYFDGCLGCAGRLRDAGAMCIRTSDFQSPSCVQYFERCRGCSDALRSAGAACKATSDTTSPSCVAFYARCEPAWSGGALAQSPPPPASSSSGSSGSAPGSCTGELEFQGIACLDDSDFTSTACRSYFDGCLGCTSPVRTVGSYCIRTSDFRSASCLTYFDTCRGCTNALRSAGASCKRIRDTTSASCKAFYARCEPAWSGSQAPSPSPPASCTGALDLQGVACLDDSDFTSSSCISYFDGCLGCTTPLRDAGDMCVRIGDFHSASCLSYFERCRGCTDLLRDAGAACKRYFDTTSPSCVAFYARCEPAWSGSSSSGRRLQTLFAPEPRASWCAPSPEYAVRVAASLRVPAISSVCACAGFEIARERSPCTLLGCLASWRSALTMTVLALACVLASGSCPTWLSVASSSPKARPRLSSLRPKSGFRWPTCRGSASRGSTASSRFAAR